LAGNCLNERNRGTQKEHKHGMRFKRKIGTTDRQYRKKKTSNYIYVHSVHTFTVSGERRARGDRDGADKHGDGDLSMTGKDRQKLE
jgi:hypothetical protein